MFYKEAKHIKTKKLKTRINITFAIDLDIDEVHLIQIEKSEGFLAFCIDEIRHEALNVIKNRTKVVDDNGITPSQKLRGRIFYKYKDLVLNQKTKEGWDEYYNRIMNYIIKKLWKE